MDSKNLDMILPSEIEMYVEDFQRSNLEELGSPKWLIYHGRFNKINQQAVIEASTLKEELVKDKLILHEKIPVIVHEIICTSLWRQYVLPELFKIDPDPKHTFMAYTIIYHEAAAVALLEAILYHEESCESLGDSVIDLIEYCVEAVSYSLSSKNIEQNTSTLDGENFLQSEVHRLKFDAGIRSISILRCLAEFIDSLAVSAAKRLYEIHDLPLLFVELIENPPWILKGSSGGCRIYQDGKWHTKGSIKHNENGKLLKLEGQVWIGILFLLMGDKCHTHYEITDARKNRLLRLQRYLHGELLDQLAPLADLVQWLTQLAISSPPFHQRPIIFELVSEIREGLLKKFSNKWAKIAKRQAETFFHSSADVRQIAKSLSEAYDMSCFESSTELMCANGCGSNGIRRCSRCKVEWYCGRECQVKHWVKHKTACNLIAQTQKDGEQD